MKPSEFLALKDLQELTGATDGQLNDMLALGCSELPIANYEDVITEKLLRVFRHITGVPWIRGFQQGARPDGQYGTIWLMLARPINQPQIEHRTVVDIETGEPRQDLCEVVTQHVEYTFQLDAYAENGTGNREQDAGAMILDQPSLSAFDVMTRLVAAFGHRRFRMALEEHCLQLDGKPFGDIRNYAKPLVHSTFEARAGVDFRVHAGVVSSLRTPTFGEIDIPDFPSTPDPMVCSELEEIPE